MCDNLWMEALMRRESAGGAHDMDWDALIRDEVAPLVPYAPGLRASEIRNRIGGGEVHKLSSNENPYGPVPAAIDAMTAVLPHLNRYPDGSARALRSRLSAHLGIEERFITVGNGSNELLRLIANAVLRPGDEVVVGGLHRRG